jgi:hypothetical protein
MFYYISIKTVQISVGKFDNSHSLLCFPLLGFPLSHSLIEGPFEITLMQYAHCELEVFLKRAFLNRQDRGGFSEVKIRFSLVKVKALIVSLTVTSSCCRVTEK